jgi:predicted transcriptional regulator
MANTLRIELDDLTRERLEAVSRRTRSQPDALLRAVLTAYLDRVEMEQREHDEDQERWAAYEATGEASDNDAVLDALERSLADASRPCPG